MVYFRELQERGLGDIGTWEQHVRGTWEQHVRLLLPAEALALRALLLPRLEDRVVPTTGGI